jgi:lysophospholipase L1-like esterase
VGYVTIQIGVNDICGSPHDDWITPVPVFQARIARALQILHEGAPDARVLLTSLADEANWNDAALQIPALAHQLADGSPCDPQAGPDGRQSPAARARIHRYEDAYDGALAAVCAGFLHCRYDGGALNRLTYRPSDVSTHDAFHPSVSGLARMAAATWKATFDFTDTVPPRAAARVTRGGTITTVALSAHDKRGVRGLEYRIGGSTWVAYVAPIPLAPGATLIYRAVDVNGNFSAPKAVVG